MQDLDVGKEETANQIEKKRPVEWEEKQVSASLRPGERHWFHWRMNSWKVIQVYWSALESLYENDFSTVVVE